MLHITIGPRKKAAQAARRSFGLLPGAVGDQQYPTSDPAYDDDFKSNRHPDSDSPTFYEYRQSDAASNSPHREGSDDEAEPRPNIVVQFISNALAFAPSLIIEGLGSAIGRFAFLQNIIELPPEAEFYKSQRTLAKALDELYNSKITEHRSCVKEPNYVSFDGS
jgi:hypothetical protein